MTFIGVFLASVVVGGVVGVFLGIVIVAMLLGSSRATIHFPSEPDHVPNIACPHPPPATTIRAARIEGSSKGKLMIMEEEVLNIIRQGEL